MGRVTTNKYDFLIKENMTSDDYKLLGTVIIRDKLENMKNKIKGIFKRESRKGR